MKSFKFFKNNLFYLEFVDEETNPPGTPAHYDVPPDFRCAGITPTKYNPDTFLPYKHLVFEHVQTGEMLVGNIIDYEHPMWNYGRQIDPEFYNSHYLNR